MVQVIEQLPNKHEALEALSSNPVLKKKTIKQTHSQRLRM
jgi:hypothetical protein